MSGTILSALTGDTATVTLSNPCKLNAIDAAMWQQLEERFAQIDADSSIRSVIIRGEGEAFAAGGDLAEFRDARSDIDSALAC